MKQGNRGFVEVLEAHVQIRQWLSGEIGLEQLDVLMSRFAEGFGMVTLGGGLLDRAALEGFFRQVHGTRPGLQIEIDQLRQIAPGVVGYREWQGGASGVTALRRATVVFEVQAERLLWLHLHETPIIQ